MEKYKYSSGLPGWGTQGKGGIDGSTGLSMYFTNLDGVTDSLVLKNKIISNLSLWSTIVTSLSDNRKYQTGDVFVDVHGKVFEIRLSTSEKFTDTGTYISVSDIFSVYDVDTDIGVTRYSNKYVGPYNIVDSIFSTTINEYTAFPVNIYGIKPINYGRIEYSDLIPESGKYNPFSLFTSGINNDNVIALVRDTVNNQFRLGNLDVNSSTRNVDLIFDVHELVVTKDPNNYFSGATQQGTVLTNYELKILNLVDPIFKADASSFKYELGAGSDVSIHWNLYDIIGTNDITNINADLYITQDLAISADMLYNFAALGNKIDSSVFVFHNIDCNGVIGLQGLTVGKTYRSWIQIYENGWERQTKRLKIYPGVTPALDISIGEGEGGSGGVGNWINQTGLLVYSFTGDGSVFNLDLDTNVDWTITKSLWSAIGIPNVETWITVTPVSGVATNRSGVWIGTHDILIDVDTLAVEEAIRAVKLTITGGSVSKELTISQIGPPQPTNTVNVTTTWGGTHSSGNGYYHYLYIYKETSPGSGLYAQYGSGWSVSGSATHADQNKIWNVPYAKYKIYAYDIEVLVGSVGKTRTQSYSETISGTAEPSNEFTIDTTHSATITITFNGI